MSETLTADQAQEMSRLEALRVLATADGVPEKDRRLAELMLAGPDITDRDERATRRPRHPLMAKAVAIAFEQLRAERADEQREVQAEMRELAGGAL